MARPPRRTDLEPLLENTAYLRRLARSLLGGSGLEDDVVQQAWLAALAKPRGSIRSPKTWLASAVRHVSWRSLRDEQRRASRERKVPVPEPAAPADASATRVEALRGLLDAVEQLPDPYRDVILQRYFDDRSNAEIAASRGVPEATVRTWVHRGLKLLRASLDPGDEESRRTFVLALLPLAGFPSEAAVTATVAVASATATTSVSAPAGLQIGWWIMNGKAVLGGALALTLGVSLWLWRAPQREDSSPTSTATSLASDSEPAAPAPGRTPLEADVAIERRRDETPAASASDWTVTGTCVSGDGEPVAGVAVRLRRFDGLVGFGADTSLLTPLADATAVSDAAGRFAWAEETPSTPVTIEAVAGGRFYSTRALRYVAEDCGPPEITLKVYPIDATVAGVVTDSERTPIAGAVVSACEQQVETGPDGRFTMPVPAGLGIRRLHAFATGFAVRHVTFEFPSRGETYPLEISLLEEQRVAGVVRDEDGAAIAGASLCDPMNPHVVVETDADGRYELGHLDPSDRFHFIEASHPGYLTESATVGTADALAQGETLSLDLVLCRGVLLRGRVLDEDGAPLNGARITAREQDGHDQESAAAARDGTFELRLTPGRHDVRTRYERLAEDARVVVVERDVEPRPIEVVLRRGHFLAGRVLDDRGAPVANARVGLQTGAGGLVGEPVGEPTETDVDGRFRIDGLPPGPLTIMISAAGHANHFEPVESLDIEHGQWMLNRAGAIIGRVVDGRTNQPVPSFRLRMVDPTLEPGEHPPNGLSGVWWQEGYQFHDEQGGFDTRPHRLEIGTVCALQAIAPDYAPATADRLIVSANPEQAPVEIRLYPPLELRGRVIDASSGLPIVDAMVREYEDTGDTISFNTSGPTARARTGGDGRFTIPLPVGEVTLRVDVPDGRVRIDERFVMPEHGGLPERTIAVAPFGRIEGRLLDATGNPRPNEPISARFFGLGDMKEWSTVTDAAGRFVFEELNAGKHYVSQIARVDGEEVRAHTYRVTVQHGETSRVTLQPSGSATLAGTVSASIPVPALLRVATAPRDNADRKDDKDGISSRAVFAKDGRFRIEGLSPGEWMVEAFFWHESTLYIGQSRATLLDRQTAEVDLQLAPDAR